MAYTVIIFVTRKQGITPLEFKTHFETSHVPLVRTITGPKFPKKHTRRYIERSPKESPPDSDTSNAKWPAASLYGIAQDLDFDAIAELSFEDEAGCKKFFEIIRHEDAQKELVKDEKLFLDRGKIKAVIVGDMFVNDYQIEK